MAERRRADSTRIPLMEAVIIIGIFALVSVFIMRMYVSADKLQGNSVNISKASIAAENVAEQIKACRSREQLVSELKLTEADAGVFYKYYDKGWQESEQEEADFVMMLSMEESVGKAGILLHADIAIYECKDIPKDTDIADRSLALIEIEAADYRYR